MGFELCVLIRKTPAPMELDIVKEAIKGWLFQGNQDRPQEQIAEFPEQRHRTAPRALEGLTAPEHLGIAYQQKARFEGHIDQLSGIETKKGGVAKRPCELPIDAAA